MPFCMQCGKELEEDARFCPRCGTPVNGTDIPQGKRSVIYEGEVHKCPNCGEVLEAFSSECPFCGYELRATQSSHAVKEFAQKLSSTKTRQEKVSLIRNFPIPNNKEDIMEFMILASTNVGENVSSDLSKAWQTKVEQAQKKCEIVIQNENEREKIQKIYDDFYKKLNRNKVSHKLKQAGSATMDLLPLLPHLVIIMAWLCSIFILLPLCRINLDNVGTNGHQLLLIADFITGAIVIPYFLRNRYDFPRLLVALGICLSVIVIIPLLNENLDNVGTNAFHLLLIFEAICTIIIACRTFKKKKTEDQDQSPIKRVHVNRAGGMLLLVCMVILLVSYGVSTYSVYDDIKLIPTDSAASNKKSGFEWLESGLSNQIPRIDAKKGRVWENSDTELELQLEGISYSRFDSYISECQDLGYNNNAVKETDDYVAYNQSGYLLELSLIGESLTINLKAPILGDQDFSWPANSMAALIPELADKSGYVETDEEKHLKFVVCNISADELKKYFDSCTDNGFNIDIERDNRSFAGFNEDGHKLNIYYGDMKEMTVEIEAPMDLSKLQWPSTGPAKLIPKPKYDKGKVGNDFDWVYSAYLSGMDIDAFNAYIEKCIDDGFKKDLRTEHYFSADKGKDVHLIVEYQGFNIVYIHISDDREF